MLGDSVRGAPSSVEQRAAVAIYVALEPAEQEPAAATFEAWAMRLDDVTERFEKECYVIASQTSNAVIALELLPGPGADTGIEMRAKTLAEELNLELQGEADALRAHVQVGVRTGLVVEATKNSNEWSGALLVVVGWPGDSFLTEKQPSS
jgi:hypothetical protein